MAGDLVIRIFNVEHGACAMLGLPDGGLVMVDCGHNSTSGWRPSEYIRYTLRRSHLDHLFIQNFDNDHVSDLPGLLQHGITVGTFYRNPSHSPADIRSMKTDGTTLGLDRAIEMCEQYSQAVPANEPNFGLLNPEPVVTYVPFWNRWPWFKESNDLSLVLFFKYAGFKILFPGDLLKAGWRSLLQLPAFVNELYDTDVLVASHHGRDNGFCDEVFQYCKPQLVVISDKEIMHESQETTQKYYLVGTDAGVPVIGQQQNRYVMTTRKEAADIIFRVTPQGRFYTATGKSSRPQIAA
jgi:beta-lactamase superfamily II metal-dependent hydrolase